MPQRDHYHCLTDALGKLPKNLCTQILCDVAPFVELSEGPRDLAQFSSRERLNKGLEQGCEGWRFCALATVRGNRGGLHRIGAFGRFAGLAVDTLRLLATQ
jgi:hypothetical protein